jgi:hypothetical protein
MTGRCRFTGVYVTNDDNVNVKLILWHFEYRLKKFFLSFVKNLKSETTAGESKMEKKKNSLVRPKRDKSTFFNGN